MSLLNKMMHFMYEFSFCQHLIYFTLLITGSVDAASLTTFHLALKCALGFLVTMAMTGLWQAYMLHPSTQQMVWF